jgi:hypothetical protein
VFPSEFVLKSKRLSDEDVESHKARLVLVGNLQRPHVDCYDTYPPASDCTVVRIMFVLACDQKWLIHQLDVKCAFRNGRIDEDIYTRLWFSRWTSLQAQEKHFWAEAGVALMEQATHARSLIRRLLLLCETRTRVPYIASTTLGS